MSGQEAGPALVVARRSHTRQKSSDSTESMSEATVCSRSRSRSAHDASQPLTSRHAHTSSSATLFSSQNDAGASFDSPSSTLSSSSPPPSCKITPLSIHLESTSTSASDHHERDAAHQHSKSEGARRSGGGQRCSGWHWKRGEVPQPFQPILLPRRDTPELNSSSNSPTTSVSTAKVSQEHLLLNKLSSLTLCGTALAQAPAQAHVALPLDISQEEEDDLGFVYHPTPPFHGSLGLGFSISGELPSSTTPARSHIKQPKEVGQGEDGNEKASSPLHHRSEPAGSEGGPTVKGKTNRLFRRVKEKVIRGATRSRSHVAEGVAHEERDSVNFTAGCLPIPLPASNNAARRGVLIKYDDDEQLSAKHKYGVSGFFSPPHPPPTGCSLPWTPKSWTPPATGGGGGRVGEEKRPATTATATRRTPTATHTPGPKLKLDRKAPTAAPAPASSSSCAQSLLRSRAGTLNREAASVPGCCPEVDVSPPRRARRGIPLGPSLSPSAEHPAQPLPLESSTKQHAPTHPQATVPPRKTSLSLTSAGPPHLPLPLPQAQPASTQPPHAALAAPSMAPSVAFSPIWTAPSALASAQQSPALPLSPRGRKLDPSSVKEKEDHSSTTAQKGSVTPTRPSSTVSEGSTIPPGDGACGRSSKRDEEEEVEMTRRAALVAWVEEGRSAARMAALEEGRLRDELRGD
ncbi:hypothetical protein BDZ90DRAFT_233275 [Jaminaea rosea]|uniref:Uncharacterized protein n=1 Tax=Jaminaea rosea TaxID=1569628 RepID=A0A316ULL9_9BASI|nr:hypothetical protein BDZ90DRAFT_233275 [Jaminaea rosea]PWN26130.1 hypothetical protein BDZ90DRAFT_233275 [Jaminaea rosea]